MDAKSSRAAAERCKMIIVLELTQELSHLSFIKNRLSEVIVGFGLNIKQNKFHK